ncbi:hypothetical protein ACIA8O_32320 [Kitasatospora sp. NPDC051853]|uniref:hypothetical protein n=1 Tax=Kitasatospora sp. NPDC051853 TaxID=3364058 RepID=UPI00378AB6E1
MTWSFEIDEDDDLVVHAPPGVPENTRRAVETLVLPFGLNDELTRTYLGEWRKMEAEFGTGYSLSTAAGAARRTGPDTVTIVDWYGQFEDCDMAVREFEDILERLVAFLEPDA